MFSHCTTDKPEPHGTTARLKYATPKEEEVRKLSSSDLKDYAGGAAVGSGAGAGVVGAGIGALIGGIVGSIFLVLEQLYVFHRWAVQPGDNAALSNFAEGR